MSVDFDFEALEAELRATVPSLRENALDAWTALYEDRRRRLLVVAHEKIEEVLGFIEARACTDVVVEVKNDDGDGNVELTIDGLRFRVIAIFYDDKDDNIGLCVKDYGGTWIVVSSLAQLGKQISEGKFTDNPTGVTRNVKLPPGA